MKDIWIIQHIRQETPGTLAELLLERGFNLRTFHPYLGDTVPTQPENIAGLVVMGGPMGVYDKDTHPNLTQEMQLIQNAHQAQVPVVGICLGSQLIAASLGAEVRSSGYKEIGWYNVKRQSSTDPLFKNLPENFMGFHWHGDIFDLPEGAELLASSALTTHQAYRVGASTYGLLFHMEVTPQIVQDMVQVFQDELAQEGLSGADILRETQSLLPELKQHARQVFGAWIELVESRILTVH
ncbi:type 1 glutamine amidotransferase [Deinococcus cellulosilyticus]|uniref:Glutamine amidotransferase domain-containing protein n=1 Tax=Deinococcus cellulosilyticus (strain DSM 18568 / NBRC 106333 / KACC 11606 / 5516J-15) TaxID=1223518 RepID=A0A511MVW6_DEIC1|nr:gamma-glutamyl-gamma-aminobutyrate hydrolase family protein [Deinococcus cellulosilyticus]GEM44714.1 hypothetical protein DC3_03490 [Deinococcus cellulosilyticus NBRC 106333 = KACC 11606]